LRCQVPTGEFIADNPEFRLVSVIRIDADGFERIISQVTLTPDEEGGEKNIENISPSFASGFNQIHESVTTKINASDNVFWKCE
jgi:hypothetical protein